VRLKNGSVVRVTLQNFKQIRNMIDRILFLGDILIGFGDFLYNNKPLLPSGFTEEWWREELRAVIKQDFDGSLEQAAAAVEIPTLRFEGMLDDPFRNKPSAREAIALSSTFKVPLHPFFTFFWSSISSEEFQTLRKWLLDSERQIEASVVQEITGVKNKTIKGLLERICVPHEVVENKIKIKNGEAHTFAFCLGLHASKTRIVHSKNVFEIMQKLTGIAIREKASTVLGARMGRPEKAKRREMRPLVHIIFPVGLAGGSRRNLTEALSKVAIEVDLVKRRCLKCSELTFKTKCPRCGSGTVVEKFCPRCGKRLKESFCPICKVPTRSYEKQLVNVKELMGEACRKLKLPIPELVKGVKGLMNETKTAEILEKGVLRAKHDLSVFKDGTIRFDVTNAPLTHFKATEIGVPVEMFRQLGYHYDCDGNSLTDSSQVCELRVQDVIIPLKSAEYFVRVASFLDELLEKVYELPPTFAMLILYGIRRSAGTATAMKTR